MIIVSSKEWSEDALNNHWPCDLGRGDLGELVFWHFQVLAYPTSACWVPEISAVVADKSDVTPEQLEHWRQQAFDKVWAAVAVAEVAHSLTNFSPSRGKE